MIYANDRVAIVGMAGRFPGCGSDLEQFWQNIVQGKDCSREVPEGRWHVAPEKMLHPEPGHPDTATTSRGYYLDPFQPDLRDLAIPSELVDELDPLFHLILDVGNRAWRTAITAPVDRRKVGVVLGNICLPTEKASALARQYLGRPFGLRQMNVAGINRYAAGLPAGLLAKGLGLGGGTFTLDAACASSLYAIKLACDELLSGRADLMLAGGASRPDCQYTQLGFAQLRALSASGRCSPFDATADGLVVGEGAGVFVLKRLTDAISHGDVVHGIIAGAGLSNDLVGNLLAPAIEGQLRAMREAYRQANWMPTEVGLIECHATGTPVGDAVEFDSLCELWRATDWRAGQCVIGSVKSTVGHLLTGAGAAALMKVLKAITAGVLPPQANFQKPGENLRYDNGPFRVLVVPEPWKTANAYVPRRAAISGFGFGGVNAHLLVEQYLGQTYVAEPSSRSGVVSALMTRVQTALGDTVSEAQDPIAIVGMGAQFGALPSLHHLQEALFRPTPPRPATTSVGWNASAVPSPAGYYLNELAVPVDKFRIPPVELEAMLPQQLLMLQTAAAALSDTTTYTEVGPMGDPRTGVYIGLGLDLNTTNFHLRWAVKDQSESLADFIAGPLTANKVMGALGSVAASRIARAFRFGGPSFTVCNEETSSCKALELAVRALRAGELDRAVVGGVELGGDPRTLLATATERPFNQEGTAQPMGMQSSGAVPGEGAAAVVLKRLEDAERDGDRIYAVLCGVGGASGGNAAKLGPEASVYASSFVRACADAGVAPNTIDYLELAAGSPREDQIEAEAVAALLMATERIHPLWLGTAKTHLGQTGFASGLASVIKTTLALYQTIVPPTPAVGELRPELLTVQGRFLLPTTPQFWLRDQVVGPRRAAVAAVSSDGNVSHVVLQEYTKKTVNAIERQQPLGARDEGLFAVEGENANELLDGLSRLKSWVVSAPRSIEAMAREWFRRVPLDARQPLAITFVARSATELTEQLDFATEHLTNSPELPIPTGRTAEPRIAMRDRVFFEPFPVGKSGKVAYVYPGSGNHFAGMGRELGVQWPEILRKQSTQNLRLRSQYAPEFFWNDRIPAQATPCDYLFGQVTLGTLTSDLMLNFGLKPDAMIGQSLGESAGLFGLRVWTTRDEMYERLQLSSLFRTDLAPPYDAAREFYHTPPYANIDWCSGVVSVAPDDVRPHLRPELRAYLLIVNTPSECVIGGLRDDVEKLVAAIGCPFVELRGVTLAHCAVARPVERAYRELHRLPVAPPVGVKFYSGAWSREYRMTEENAADSITAGLLNTIELPHLIETAYRDGVRVFLEVGPGKSTTRMIDATLGDRPHIARAICSTGGDSVSQLLRSMARLHAARVPLNLAKLYPTESKCVAHQVPLEQTKHLLTIATGNPVVRPNSPRPAKPAAPMATPAPVPTPAPIAIVQREPEPVAPIIPAPHVAIEEPVPVQVATPLPALRPATVSPSTITPPPRSRHIVLDTTTFVVATARSQDAIATAHEQYLRLQDNLMTTSIDALKLQTSLLNQLLGGQPQPTESTVAIVANEVPRSLSFEQCTTFAVGKIADVLGPSFAEVDTFPTRVRLPEGPLMLVDKVRLIEGEPKSMTRGRVVTEHAVRADRWYLDANRCPTSITVESGQADLFLAGYLGIDFQTRGGAVYRLLDAVVTFHRGLPKVGETIEYDIHIDEFFHQADAWLFRFKFEGRVSGEPLLSMQNGVAGFFTPAALAAGQGIVHTKLDREPQPGKKPADWSPLVPVSVSALDAHQIESLRRGDLPAAFGPGYPRPRLNSPMRLPGGMLRLVDRVTRLEPDGGRFGLGSVRAEYDLRPREWFIECHFIDDKVMPGTLMYECCLHTLRILLMRFGWIGEESTTVCEPVAGIKSRLKCRGQVLDSTKLVTYEVSIKELGYNPAPFCIADALMYADGKPIVEITNLSLQMTGLTHEQLQMIWGRSHPTEAPPSSLQSKLLNSQSLYNSAKILAYSNGNPSEAFGEPYRIFDRDRVIARLPGPPYQFLDQITGVRGEPFVLKAGASCVAEYQVPPEAWYFDANRSTLMPFSVLLEIALQPCGWLAAYCGSALTSQKDLSFRNLGGEAVQFRPVTPDAGVLTTTVTLKNVSSSAGMIIQHYDLCVRQPDGKVYEGTTYFGFFAKDALQNQVGMPTAKVPFLTDADRGRAECVGERLPPDAPFPRPQLRMVDRIDGYLPEGGAAQLGLIQGRIAVDPSAWFFQAHFYQDPVWPGSLGLESFLQLLKFVAVKKFGTVPKAGFQTVALHEKHNWIYRGQVLPTDREVVVVLEITDLSYSARRLTASGFLVVDGRIIYQMIGFTLE